MHFFEAGEDVGSKNFKNSTFSKRPSAITPPEEVPELY